ncbi:MAG: Cys-tRNA(Pro) deacylase [Lachnospiraceae bacterium]
MKKSSEEKTNVMRLLEQKKIPYQAHCYVETGAVNGMEVASILGQDPEQVFKTLVTVGKTGNHYVFVIPVKDELDLKKAASVAGEKNIEMLKAKDLLGLTGYVHGGCSPIGMKKVFPTVVHETAKNYDTIIFSGGKIGYQVQVSLEDLGKIIRINTADIVV